MEGSDDTRRVEALLDRWVSAMPSRRTARPVLEVAWVGPMQLVLRTSYEERGVNYKLSPAPHRDEPDPPPDPWAIALRHAEGAAVGHRVKRTPRGAAVHMHCAVCFATGEADCPRCGGAGRTGNSAHCARCDGRGRLVCESCRGSGGVTGKPTFWSRLGAHEEMRTVGGRDLPIDVAADLAVSAQPGEIVHRQEGDRLHDLMLPGGYRDAARDEEPLVDACRRLCAEPGIPPGARVLRQVLEVRRVPVARARLEGDAEVWCWGDPPRVWPEEPLATLWGRVAAAVLGSPDEPAT
jgi:hypothetical protein